MLGECVISLVLSWRSKDLKWWTSITAGLQPRVLFGKQRKVHPFFCMRVGQPQRRGLIRAWLPPFICLSPPRLEPALCKLAWPRRGRVCFTWSSHFSTWIFFCSIFTGFFLSLAFSHCHLGLLFPIQTMRSNCQHSLDHQKSKRVPEKHRFLLYWLCQSLWLCGSPQTGKFWKRWEYQTTRPASWETCMQVRKQQLELDIEQQTGSK